MFGIDRQERRRAQFDQELSKILCREHRIAALDALTSALGTATLPIDLSECAIALDSSVFLRLASHEKSADAIDYLNGQHSCGIIIPGQSIQEFWNNRYNVIPSLARKIRSSFESFQRQIEELDGDFGDFKNRFSTILSEFELDYGHVFDEQTVAKTFGMLDALRTKAEVPYVSRSIFQGLAAHRQNTKTPPGFRDGSGNDGDFYVWLDTLRGVQLISRGGSNAKWLVFVTDDKKDDWSRDGMPHPILSAELRALCGLSLCIIDLNKFIKLIEQSTN